jgi:peptidoglycan/LPS O-acetylase OafA/YrhL
LIFTLAYILFFTFLRIQFSNFDLTELNITIFRLDSVAYGVLISLLHNLFKFRIKKYWLVILGAGFSLLGILLFLFHVKVGNFYMLYYSFTGFGLALCVLFLKLCYDWLRPLFNGKAISFIAKISYSLYLVNLIVIYSFISFFNAYINNFLLAFLILSFTTLFSYLTYNCIEKSFLILRDKYYPSSQQIKKINYIK